MLGVAKGRAEGFRTVAVTSGDDPDVVAEI